MHITEQEQITRQVIEESARSRIANFDQMRARIESAQVVRSTAFALYARYMAKHGYTMRLR